MGYGLGNTEGINANGTLYLDCRAAAFRPVTGRHVPRGTSGLGNHLAWVETWRSARTAAVCPSARQPPWLRGPRQARSPSRPGTAGDIRQCASRANGPGQVRIPTRWPWLDLATNVPAVKSARNAASNRHDAGRVGYTRVRGLAVSGSQALRPAPRLHSSPGDKQPVRGPAPEPANALLPQGRVQGWRDIHPASDESRRPRQPSRAPTVRTCCLRHSCGAGCCVVAIRGATFARLPAIRVPRGTRSNPGNCAAPRQGQGSATGFRDQSTPPGKPRTEARG